MVADIHLASGLEFSSWFSLFGRESGTAARRRSQNPKHLGRVCVVLEILTVGKRLYTKNKHLYFTKRERLYRSSRLALGCNSK